MTDESKRSKRGFAAMAPERLRELARRGGESVPNEKRSFTLDRELAREAGRKGGQSVKPENRVYSRDHEAAREAGRKGGLALQAKRAAQKDSI